MYRESDKIKSRIQPNDRFIPLRMPINVELLDTPSFDNISTPDGFVNYAKVRRNKENYRKALKNALMPVNTRVLNFFPPKEYQLETTVPKQETWPVKPRKKPIIGPPRIVLDMPEFDANPYHQVTDWGNNNCLTTIFEGEAHMWWPEKETIRGHTYTNGNIQNCIKWKEKGDEFATGLHCNRIGLFDVRTNKILHISSCCTPQCSILCLEWINNYLITGCSKGILRMLTFDLKRVKTVKHAHRKSIVKMVGSCNKKFLATSGEDKNVIVWNIPELTDHMLIKFPAIVTAMDWHPWKHSLLAIGVGPDEGRVTLWNVQTQKKVACEKTTYKNSTVNCLTFNPISAELVVSYYVGRNTTTTPGSGVIAALSNIDEVVEEILFHTSSIPYLLWGNKGKCLASVSADENLCIWNFFDDSNEIRFNKPISNRNKNDFVMLGSSLR